MDEFVESLTRISALTGYRSFRVLSLADLTLGFGAFEQNFYYIALQRVPRLRILQRALSEMGRCHDQRAQTYFFEAAYQLAKWIRSVVLC